MEVGASQSLMVDRNQEYSSQPPQAVAHDVAAALAASVKEGAVASSRELVSRDR